MSVHGARQKIHEAVSSWPGVTAHPHRFGGTEYRLGKRELGRIHRDQLVDIPFPRKVRDEMSLPVAPSHTTFCPDFPLILLK
jgi:hypothetical protein